MRCVLFCCVVCVVFCFVVLCALFCVLGCCVLLCYVMLYVRLPVLLRKCLHLSQYRAGITKTLGSIPCITKILFSIFSFHLCSQRRLLIQLYQAWVFFFIRGSMHRNSRLKKSNKMQQYADIHLLLHYCTCFRRPSRPTSAVHKTVVAASGTDQK